MTDPAVDYGTLAGIAVAVNGVSESIKWGVGKMLGKEAEAEEKRQGEERQKQAVETTATIEQMRGKVTECTTRMDVLSGDLKDLAKECKDLTTDLSNMRVEDVALSGKLEGVSRQTHELITKLDKMEAKMEARDEQVRKNIAEAMTAMNELALAMARNSGSA